MENPDEGTGIYSSGKQVYEALMVRPGEETGCGGEVMECDNDAIRLAQGFSAKWRHCVKLYRVPFVNTSSASSFDLWPDEVKLVADIPAPAPAK